MKNFTPLQNRDFKMCKIDEGDEDYEEVFSDDDCMEAKT